MKTMNPMLTRLAAKAMKPRNPVQIALKNNQGAKNAGPHGKKQGALRRLRPRDQRRRGQGHDGIDHRHQRHGRKHAHIGFAKRVGRAPENLDQDDKENVKGGHVGFAIGIAPNSARFPDAGQRHPLSTLSTGPS